MENRKVQKLAKGGVLKCFDEFIVAAFVFDYVLSFGFKI